MGHKYFSDFEAGILFDFFPNNPLNNNALFFILLWQNLILQFYLSTGEPCAWWGNWRFSWRSWEPTVIKWSWMYYCIMHNPRQFQNLRVMKQIKDCKWKASVGFILFKRSSALQGSQRQTFVIFQRFFLTEHTLV